MTLLKVKHLGERPIELACVTCEVHAHLEQEARPIVEIFAWGRGVLPKLDLDAVLGLTCLSKEAKAVASILEGLEYFVITRTKDNILLVLGEVALIFASVEFGLEFRKRTHEIKH